MISTNSQKGSAKVTLLVVLVVVLAGALVYFAFLKKPGEVAVSPTPTPTKVARTATPTPDETANWKTYQNEKYGFEVKHPANYFETSKSEKSISLASSESCRITLSGEVGGGEWPKECQIYDVWVQGNKITGEGDKKEFISVAGFPAEKITTFTGM